MNEMPADDSELRARLTELHVDVGPINDKTRGLYQDMLRKRLSLSQSTSTPRKKTRATRAEKEKPSRKKRAPRNTQVVDEKAQYESNDDGELQMEVEKKDDGILETLWSGPRRLWEAGKKVLFGDEEAEDMEVEMPEKSDSETEEVEFLFEINGKKPEGAVGVVVSPRKPLRPANPAHPKIQKQANGADRKEYDVAKQPLGIAIGESHVAKQPVSLARQPLDAVRGERHAARQPVTKQPVGIADREIGMSRLRQDRAMKPDWELEPWSVSICCRRDGSEWKLGQGGYGEVLKALKDGVDEVAVKRIKLGMNMKILGEFRKEVDLISQLRHRHIVQFYGACTQPDCLFMVTELMDFDLYSALHGNDAVSYMWAGKYGRSVIRGIASGLNYLHSRSPPVVHRDLKSPNILLLDGIAKIADVGLARARLQTLMTAQRDFTPIWSAPEVICREKANEKVDIWSLGVILWEVVTGKLPLYGDALRLPVSCEIQLRRLFGYCMRKDPRDRPEAADVVRTLDSL